MTPTLILAERIKPVHMGNDFNLAKRVALAGGLLSFTVEGKENTEVVNNVASYYVRISSSVS